MICYLISALCNSHIFQWEWKIFMFIQHQEIGKHEATLHSTPNNGKRHIFFSQCSQNKRHGQTVIMSRRQTSFLQVSSSLVFRHFMIMPKAGTRRYLLGSINWYSVKKWINPNCSVISKGRMRLNLTLPLQFLPLILILFLFYPQNYI